MNPLDEIEKLITLDPGGWKADYGYYGRLTRLAHGDVIAVVDYAYPSSQRGFRTIRVYPGGYSLGWWETRRFDKLIRKLTATTAQAVARKVAECLISDRNSEVEKAMRDLDDDLAAQFVALEEADKKEREKFKDAPVASGFFKGAIKQLSKGKQ